MSKKRHKRSLKSKDAKKLFLEVSEQIGTNIEEFFKSKVRVEINKTGDTDIFIFNGKPLFARSNGVLFFTLVFEDLFPIIPKIVVDMGAVPYVCKGADIMAPGILSIKNDFKKNDLILIVDERHHKPLAIGLALFSSEEMKTIKRGKTVMNLHYVGDKLWTNIKTS